MGKASNLGYQLKVKPGTKLLVSKHVGGNNLWMIQIHNNQTQITGYRGILMYVHQYDKPENHLGQFVFKDTSKWQFMDSAICSREKISQSTPHSTVTHKNANTVLLSSNNTFVWTGNATELALNGLVVNAVVANSADKWQKLQFFGIPPTVDTKATTTSLTTTTTITTTTTTTTLAPTNTDVSPLPSEIGNGTSTTASDTSSQEQTKISFSLLALALFSIF